MVTRRSTALEAAEFYRRLDEMCPGDVPAGTTPALENLDIYCERLTLNAIGEIHKYSLDSKLYEFLEIPAFETLADTTAYVEKLLGRVGSSVVGRGAMYWVLRRKTDHRLVGTMSLVSVDYERQSAEWGYGLDPEFWGEGYVLQLQELLKHFAFEVLGLNRLHGKTMLENQRTIASVLAAGMKHEGTLRDYYSKDGVYRDAWLYGMLRKDYLQEKQAQQLQGATIGVEEVRQIVAAALDDPSVTADSGMHDLLTWDSLSHMTIMVAVSTRTGITLSPTDMTRATSVKAIASLLAERS